MLPLSSGLCGIRMVGLLFGSPAWRHYYPGSRVSRGLPVDRLGPVGCSNTRWARCLLLHRVQPPRHQVAVVRVAAFAPKPNAVLALAGSDSKDTAGPFSVIAW